MSRAVSRRPATNVPLTGRRIGVLPVLLIVASLVATCGGPPPATTLPSQSPAPSTATAPTSSPGVTPLPTASPVTGSWSKLDLPADAQVATLVATRTGAGSVALDTAFRLTSLDGTAARDVAARLVVTPALKLTVATATPTVAELRPPTPLEAARVYRFELHRTDGTTAAAWAVQAAAPLAMTSTLPGNAATNVPRDTGIEVTFNQAGVRLADVESHFSITPAVKGRLEQHGRTFAFVPSSPLAASTLYAVTISHGVPLPGTGMALEQDVVVRFETTGNAVSWVVPTMSSPMFDAGTAERAVIRVDLFTPEGVTEKVKTVSVTVHRLPDMGAAMDAYARIEAAPDWTQRSGTTPVRTSSLALVLKATLPLQPFNQEPDWTSWFQLPETLPAGWYVVTMTHAAIARQAVLQVTDLAAYTMVTRTRSLAWVNDLVTDLPVAGASVSIAGAAIGATTELGVAVAATPAATLRAVETGSRAFAVVEAGTRQTFVPLGSHELCDKACGGWVEPATDAWWHLLSTDRGRYRVSDTVHAWGVILDRDTDKAPASVVVRLKAGDPAAAAQPAIATATATPDASGVFLVRLPFANLPPGHYVVEASVGPDIVGEQWIEIGPIAKPAWQIALTTPHGAVLSGSSVPLSAVATFFEGTPVAGASLRFGESVSSSGSTGALVATDADGRASGSVRVALEGWEDQQWGWGSVSARANEPEEADISAEVPINVFASTALVDSRPTLKATTLTLAGAVHDVAFDRYDAPGTDAWNVEPRGAPRAGARVSLEVVEVVPVVRQTGTTYDFITKRAVPTYSVTERRVTLGTFTATTGADGTFRRTMTVTGGDRSYEVRAWYTDEAARKISDLGHAGNYAGVTEYRSPWLTNAEAGNDSREYSVGDTVRVQFSNGAAKPPVARYLFTVLARGLAKATIQDAGTYAFTFTDAMVPGATVGAVRFTGTGYEVAPAAYRAALRLADRTLDVQLTPSRDRYSPRDRVTVAIRTLDAKGRPVAASVYVRAIDEKLFAVGAATEGDPVAELYAAPGSGLLVAGWSHVDPNPELGGGGGDVGGGDGGREDFRDWLTAQLVTTGADGRASVSFDLSDDLTSWRVIGSAVTPRLEAGTGSVTIPVSLPFFVDAIVAPEYLASDRPLVRVRAYGTNLATGAPVTFTVSSDTLPLAPTTVSGTAFQVTETALPALTVGTHRLQVRAVTGSGSAQRQDTVVRTFDVVDRRAIRTHETSVPLSPGTTVGGGNGNTTVLLVDAGRGRVVPLLSELAGAEPVRADRAIAASLAREVLATEFDSPPDPGLPDSDLLAFQHWDGISILPYASGDLELTAMAALSGDRHLDRSELGSALEYRVADGALTTEDVMYLLLGRAALGSASIVDVTEAAARTDLTPRERVVVALAAVAVGDLALARTIERDLLARYGERLGPWVRLRLDTPELTAVWTARLAIVAAALGDPLAADMDAEVAAHPPADTIVDLERAIAASYWAHRMPKVPAVAAVTVDGRRAEVNLSGDGPVRLQVTPAQRAGFRVDPVSGSALVVARWDGPVAAGDLSTPAGMSVTRTVVPAGVIGATQTVVVTFAVTLGPAADPGCWQLTDFAPSGLVPVAAVGRESEVEGGRSTGAIAPWHVTGQRVDFCVARDSQHPTQTLRYLARVVTPGVYTWEPAVLQSSLVPEQGVVLPAFGATIKGLGS